MFGSDRLRAPDLLFHVGGPVLALPLCGTLEWVVLVCPDRIQEYAANGEGLCPECYERYQEQHISKFAAVRRS
jgi:hypothetical protein